MIIEPSELVTHASAPAVLVGEGQRVLAINEAAEELLGYDHAEAVERTCNQLVCATFPDGAAICSEHCLAVPGFRSCRPLAAPECTVRRKDGSRITVAMSSIALGDGRHVIAADAPLAILFLQDRAQLAAGEREYLSISTFGRFAASIDGSSLAIEQWPRKQAIQLLKFLTFHGGRPVHRDRLIDQLWPDADTETGWSRLKVTVHFLRQRFRQAGLPGEIVSTEEAAYVLRLDHVQVDSLLFEDLARIGHRHQRAGDTTKAIAAFREAQALYRGDYMEADLYADWCAEERERLLDIYIDVVNALAELSFAAGDYASAAQDCHTALVREPCRESAHRLLIQSLIALHRPDRAIQQFERCRSLLAAELGVAPSPETAALVAPVLHGTTASTAGPGR